jgi:hypothetical protein
MGRYYDLCDTTRPLLRGFALLAYAIGFVLLLIPTVITFFQVLCRAILGP